MPETYPVHGKVVFEGGQPVPAGTVTFQPQNNRTVSTSGVIGADGTFTLCSFKAGVRAPGAIAGPQRVTVTSLDKQMTSESFPPVIFPSPYTVQPGNNEFTLTVPRGAR